MTNDNDEFVKRLAQGNAVDVEKLRFVSQQLRELERAGIQTRREYSIERPLGRLVQVGTPGTLANVGDLTQR
jgi:hypothetical protein